MTSSVCDTLPKRDAQADDRGSAASSHCLAAHGFQSFLPLFHIARSMTALAFAAGTVVVRTASQRPPRTHLCRPRVVAQRRAFSGAAVAAHPRCAAACAAADPRAPAARPRRGVYMLDKAETSPVIRVVAGLMAVGLLATSILPLSGGFADAFKDTGGVLVDQKLHRVPVFTVSDDEGRPFLVEAEDHLSRKGYFFMDPEDAQKYLARVKEEGAASAKVLPVGMDEALKFTMKRGRSSAKAVPEVFALFPSERELKIATDVTGGQFANIFGQDAVPIYYADGLAFASPVAGGDSGVAGGSVGAVYPLFFEKSKLDETLSGLREKDPVAAKAIGDIQVLSLQQTVKVRRDIPRRLPQ